MMLKGITICVLIVLACLGAECQSQAIDSATEKLINFPSKLFSRTQRKAAVLDQQLNKQTEKYLKKLARKEAQLQRRLAVVDSAAANRLFGKSAQQYSTLITQLQKDSGTVSAGIHGQYLANLDSEKVSLMYLQQHPEILGNAARQAEVEKSLGDIQKLQSKLGATDQIQAFISQRKNEINDYFIRLSQLPQGVSQIFAAFNRDQYYYAQQLQQYKQMLNDPDKLYMKALSMMDQLPAFRQFMQGNSQLAALFGTPTNYGSAQSITGLLTRDQMQKMIQGQFSSSESEGASGGMAAVEQNIQAAETQLDQIKDKLSKFGGSGSEIVIPDFKPNDQKTKTFWKRLELGTNFQTTKTNYFPTTTDFGISVGYKLGIGKTIGVGGSYKLGWGANINRVAFSSQGVGVRSFLDIGIKGSLSVTGGVEYNYAMPFNSFQQIRNLSYWTRSGLIGATKTMSIKSTVFKRTKLQILWDFLSYSQIPKTPPIVFRIGYNL
jgi:hypothetical protein